MYRRLKRQLLCFALVGLLSSFLLTSLSLSDANATNPELEILGDRHGEFSTSALNLEQRGQKFYLLGNFSQAITLWQLAAIAYSEKQEVLNQVRVLSNLALAYHQLGDAAQANKLAAWHQPSSSNGSNRPRQYRCVISRRRRASSLKLRLKRLRGAQRPGGS